VIVVAICKAVSRWIVFLLTPIACGVVFFNRELGLTLFIACLAVGQWSNLFSEEDSDII
jgi:hypothetical protein